MSAHKFKIGDQVTWKSQANGGWKTKTGTITRVFPAWRNDPEAYEVTVPQGPGKRGLQYSPRTSALCLLSGAEKYPTPTLLAQRDALLAACEGAEHWFREYEEDNTDKHTRHASEPIRAAIALTKGEA